MFDYLRRNEDLDDRAEVPGESRDQLGEEEAALQPLSGPSRLPAEAGSPRRLKRRPWHVAWSHCWVVALLLGTGGGVLAWRVGDHCTPTPAAVYEADCMLLIEWSSPRMAAIASAADRGNHERRRELVKEWLCSRPVIEEAMQMPGVTGLPEGKRKVDVVQQWLKSSLHVECNDSDVCRAALRGEDAEQIIPILAALKEGFFRVYLDASRKDAKARLSVVEQTHASLHKEILAKRKDLVMLGSEQATDGLAQKTKIEPRIDEIQKKIQAAEGELTRARLREEQLRSSAPPRRSTQNLEGVVNQLVERDSIVRENEDKALEVYAFIARLEKVATKPRKLDEYREAIVAHQSLRRAAEARRESVRPVIERQLRAQASAKTPQEQELIEAEQEAQIAKEHVAELNELLQDQLAMLSTLEKSRAKLQVERKSMAEQARRDLDSLQEKGKKLEAESEALRAELTALMPIKVVKEAVEAALLPGAPIWWRWLGTGIGLATGTLLSLSVVVAERRARKVRLPEDLAQELDLDVLAVIPTAQAKSWPRPRSRSQSETIEQAADELAGVLVADRQTRWGRVLAVTSAVSEEGKSHVAAHLAASLARTGRKTILVDTHLSRPRAHALLRGAPLPGLADVLNGKSSIKEATQSTSGGQLALLAAGAVDLKALKRMQGGALELILQELRRGYDHIILDTGSVLAATMGLQAARQADVVLISARQDFSNSWTLHAALDRLEQLGTRIIGSVFLEAGAFAIEKQIGQAQWKGMTTAQGAEATAVPQRQAA